MKKNLILFLLLIVLALITWYFVNKQNTKGNKSFDFSYREFAVENLDEIDRIVVSKRNASPFSFKRNGNEWIINDKYKARKNAMDNMLDVIHNIKIDYVPPMSATEGIMKSFVRHGIKVELYDNDNNSIKKYYVGSSPANGLGSYFVMDGFEKPIVMSLPSMDGNVHTRFNYTLDQWRDMSVIDLKGNEIDSVMVSYPFNKKLSFIHDGKSVSPLHKLQKAIKGEANNKLIETYLLGFENKIAEYIENDNPRKDSIINQVPFCEMSIVTKDGTRKSMRFFYHSNDEVDMFKSQTGNLDPFNTHHAERFFIQSNWGDFYLAQYFVFQEVFWKYDSFYK